MSALAVEIERLAFRAWPSADEETLEGWTLRHSPGLRARRINSATSPLGGAGDVDHVGDVIGAWYERRNAAPLVRMLSVTDATIDRHFASLGWADESPTAVMTKSLRAADASMRPVVVSSALTARWLAAKQRMTAMADDTRAAWEARAAAIVGSTVFAAMEEGGDVVAIGLGVVDDGWVGIFDMQTTPQLRRRGCATAIVRTLESSALAQGATAAYLQVEMRNVPARAFYAREGYVDVYRYWYRRQPA